MRVDELIAELEKLPKYAIVNVLKEYDNGLIAYGVSEKVVLSPYDDDDDYLERYVTIKAQ